MKIQSLKISNFRGIREVVLQDLGSMVIIAGQNGSGKSCLFDAIRLLKSVYGGYQQNEWQQWMGEFQITLSNRSSDFEPMFNDRSKELRISCGFQFSEEEKLFIKQNAVDLLREAVWRTLVPEAYQWGGLRMAAFAAQFREREPEVAQRVNDMLPLLEHELNAEAVKAEFFIEPRGVPHIADSVLLSSTFSTFRPKEIGVIDFHGAQRHYGRELVQGINLNLEVAEQQRSQSALYNYGNKYNNVKGEMAASYVKEILSEQAGVPRASQSSLTNTLQELFATFFPEKKFLGPQPTVDGRLSFPVRIGDDSHHDLDELSAGEKEILYGYLRIRNSAPRHSIILLDEPELHLNPRLIRGLPEFYRKNLGEALSNQMWLVTHSDALLREVVGRRGYDVFHMLPCASTPLGESQLRPLSANADLDLALVDLVGDLAAFRPGGKVVIFEGGGDSEFDKRVVSALFPELAAKSNLVSGANKLRVRALHETLDRAASQGALPYVFCSITDKDAGGVESANPVNHYEWDAYHIENYFLDAAYIARIHPSLDLLSAPSEEEVLERLKGCARETLPDLVRHELARFANEKVVGAINTKTDPGSRDSVNALISAIDRSLGRLQALAASELGRDALEELKNEAQRKYESSLEDGSWLVKFRGRDVLKRYVGKYVSGANYEVFRNLLLTTMAGDSYRPPGMRRVVDAILEA